MSETTSSYPFAASRIKAMEAKLITRDKLNRVIESKDYESSVHVLQELGYGQTLTGKLSFEQLIEKELELTDELLIAISPSDIFTKMMRAQKDYHNLKILIKLLMLDKSLEDIDLSPGNIGVDILKRAIAENNYFELSERMKEALLYIDKQFAIAADVSIIGVALDRAYAKEITGLVKEMDDALVTEYFNAYFDLSNIIAFMRVRISGHRKESFDDSYLWGGSIEKRTFSEAFELADESIFSAVVKGEFAAALAPAYDEYLKTKSLYMMEKAKDDYLMALLKKQRHDMFGIAPLMCYYVAKQREAAAVRMVMTAKQGGIDNEVVTKRLKELY